jgi:hypothetical protein
MTAAAQAQQQGQAYHTYFTNQVRSKLGYSFGFGVGYAFEFKV